MYKLGQMSDADVEGCGEAVRALGAEASTMEETAKRIVSHLHEQLGDDSGGRGCALVRFYKTHAFGELAPDLQSFARGVLGEQAASDDMKCLTLLATVGEEGDWNDRGKSAGHKAIPLPSEDFVAQIPMIARLVHQLGLEARQVIRPDPALLVDLGEKTYNVFHVEEAVGSPFIPAQNDFVVPHGVRSVLGFGGMLETGDLYVVILFSKVPIGRAVAERFKPMAASVREAVAGFATGPVFA